MPYLIDGHNLIGQMGDISLTDPDDEARLIARLRTWCEQRRVSATVFFDRGAPGAADSAGDRRLRVRFVRPPRSADDAIGDHLRRLGRAAAHWTVVSSDRGVQSAARRAGARILKSSEFAATLMPPDTRPSGEKPSGASPQEVQAWLDEFLNRE